MTDPNYTYLVFLLDMSGSMEKLRDEAISGFNEFLRDQQTVPGKCTLRLVTFNSRNYLARENDLAHFVPLDYSRYQPAAMTPLWDSLDRTLDETGQALEALPAERRPGKVIFATLTDGLENVSRHATQDSVKAKIEHQKTTYAWEFIYLGLGLDQFQQEQHLAQGDYAPVVMAAMATPEGITGGLRSVSHSVTGSRTRS